MTPLESGAIGIDYKVGNIMEIADVVDCYRACSLGARRPVEDVPRMQAMLNNANLVVSAWEGRLLVGIARSLTDFTYVTYLSDLAVRDSHQRLGIGKELIRITQREGGADTRIVLLAAPAAVDYYPHIGFDKHPSAWTLAGDAKI